MLEDTPLPTDSAFTRCWRAIPDWVFRAMGVCFFVTYVALQASDYRKFPNFGHYILESDGQGKQVAHYFPLARILSDLTFVLIALAFVIRLPPRERAATPDRIIIPVIAGFWPLIPFMTLAILKLIHSPLATTLNQRLGFGPINRTEFYAGVALLSTGLAVQIWSYAYLARSLSIVAEARNLMTRGPFRFVRHPIYAGQFIAQAGFWLILVRLQAAWVIFYLVFVAMQLYRSWIEEQVLAEAFGESYLTWKRKTFWFF
jgi:protein-S-isoprenylcysteine O-methyltransferase Ste14